MKPILFIFYLLLPFFPKMAEASTNEIKIGYCQYVNQHWQLNINASLDLSQDMADALKNGILLPLEYEIRFQKGGADDAVEKITIPFELTYNHITQNYLLVEGKTRKETNSPTLSDMLSYLTHLSHYPVMGSEGLTPDKIKEISMRLIIDRNKLPFPIRLASLFSSDWKINSTWWQCQIQR